MGTSINLNISKIIGGNLAVATSDGEIVFKDISVSLSRGEDLVLDFKEINILTTAFLNAAIGQLYSEQKFSSDFLNQHLNLVNIQELDVPLFSLVIQRAKEYFANKKLLEDSANSALYG